MPDDVALAPAEVPARRDGPRPSGRGPARYLVLLLFLVGVFNAMDRHILVVLLEPIRREFGASDTAMGVLTGFAFVLFYSFATLPIARLSDARPRRTIIVVGLTCWSAMTAVSGFVRSFGQLALTRVGVGVGEASFIPAGMSMISDRFPAERRTLAMAMLSLSFPVGSMLSLMVGGRLGAAVGWRAALIWLGILGLALAALVATTLREPDRGAAERRAGDAALYGPRETIAYLTGLSSLRHLAAGGALSFFAFTAVGTWAPSFLMRVHGMDLAGAGSTLGPAAGLGGITGVLLGGLVTQRLARSDMRWLLRAPAIAEVLAVPFAVLFLTLPDSRVAVLSYIGVTLFGGVMMAPVMTAVQGLAKLRMRALAAAGVSMTINLTGLGLGPLVAGALSDALQPVFGVESLRYALLVTASFSLWAATHFALGARSLVGDLERAARA